MSRTGSTIPRWVSILYVAMGLSIVGLLSLFPLAALVIVLYFLGQIGSL